MKSYSLGFMFDKPLVNVLLIRKERPPWQAGFLNGIGGHIENSETPCESMVREFMEEVGIRTNTEDWKHYCVLNVLNHRCNKHATVYVFTTVGDIWLALAKTDEVPTIISRFKLYEYNTIDNLPWLIPLAFNVLKDKQPDIVSVQYRNI